MLKTICNNGKVNQPPHVSTLLQSKTDDCSFQNFKLYYIEWAKITVCNNSVIWTIKVIGCVKSRFVTDSHEDIIQAEYKVLNCRTVIEETSKKNATRSEYETEQERKGK